MSHTKPKNNVLAPQSRFYQGPFGRLCPDLPAWSPEGVEDSALENHFLSFANHSMIESPGHTPTEIADNDELRAELDAEFNSAIPAGYTYFGQFIDHDITLDVTPLSESEIDPEKLRNFRTPRLDLDCVYGRGPEDQPYLYEHDEFGVFTGRLLIGEIDGTNFSDLLRNNQGRAIIGDKRNDENAIVAQIQLAFIKAHNTLVDRALASGRASTGGQAFALARRTLRRLYQWIVWNDFLSRVTDPGVHECALQLTDLCGGRVAWELGLDDIYRWKRQPFMPVEFSVAAYRFGHSLARNSYQTNAGPDAGFHEFIPLFDLSASGTDDLHGFRPLNTRRVIQWDWFLPMETSSGEFPQPARKIDTKLSNALAFLLEDLGNPGSILNVLAARNLVRGVRMKLPSGPDVARKFGIQPIDLEDHEPEALWYYILKEAEAGGGESLGPVGSIIVCATFAGLLKGDGSSWINVDPLWTPDQDPLLEPDDNLDPGEWTLASVIRLSGLPVSGADL